MRTQVGIIGSGPAGLLLAHTLAKEGIESVILERQSRAHVEGRIRAGVLEQGTVEMLRQIGVNEEMDRKGIPHKGFSLAFDGRQERIDLSENEDGKSVMIYGQTEMTGNLIKAHLDAGNTILFESPALYVRDFESGNPVIVYEQHGEQHELQCDFVAGRTRLLHGFAGRASNHRGELCRLAL